MWPFWQPLDLWGWNLCPVAYLRPLLLAHFTGCVSTASATWLRCKCERCDRWYRGQTLTHSCTLKDKRPHPTPISMNQYHSLFCLFKINSWQCGKRKGFLSGGVSCIGETLWSAIIWWIKYTPVFDNFQANTKKQLLKSVDFVTPSVKGIDLDTLGVLVWEASKGLYTCQNNGVKNVLMCLAPQLNLIDVRLKAGSGDIMLSSDWKLGETMFVTAFVDSVFDAKHTLLQISQT